MFPVLQGCHMLSKRLILFLAVVAIFSVESEHPKPETYVICPPTLQCSEFVQREDPDGWALRGGYDKSLAQRTFEFLVVYDWVDVDKQQVRWAYAITEAVRQLMCAATVARCDPSILQRAINAARVFTQNDGTTSLAENTFKVCDAVDLDLPKCLRAALTWAEAEYVLVLAPFGEIDFDIEADKQNKKKIPASTNYPALLYPADLIPEAVCQLGGTARHHEWPLFGGEAFGGNTWVDVLNLKTRHLGFFATLEVIENGATFRMRHPGGLSGVVVNFGAGDGVCRSAHGVDPANCLFATGFSGVLFEANPKLHGVILETLGHRQPDIVIVPEAADPATVSTRLAEALALRPGPPLHHTEIDLIKVDVDGCDCALVDALIASGWRPKVWHVEINPLFPPGVIVRPRDVAVHGSSTLGSAFSQSRSVADTNAGIDFLIGCSLQALLEIVGPEYELLHVEFENAVLVRQDLTEALRPWLSAYDVADKWRIGYFCNPMARIRQPHDMDENSWFLRYDFRRWGDPSLPFHDMSVEVEHFLRYFSALDGYYVSHMDPSGSRRIPLLSSFPIGLTHGSSHRSSTPGDLDCKDPWKGEVLNWDAIYSSIERVLKLWSTGADIRSGTNLGGLIVALTEEIANHFNIDHSWEIFKALSRSECPLGGICIVVLFRWRCGSIGAWELNREGSAGDRLFTALELQLPILHESSVVMPKLGFGTPASLGCEAMLERYLEAALHRIDLPATLRSRWPVFELLSALHTENERWPRGYP